MKQMEEPEVNRCVICGEDLGACNPRQLCKKTYCPMEQVESDTVLDHLLYSDLFTEMEGHPRFNPQMGIRHQMFLRKHSQDLLILNNSDQQEIQQVVQVELCYRPILRYDGHTWIIYQYPETEVGSVLHEWSQIAIRMVSSSRGVAGECRPPVWIQNGDQWLIRIDK